ncbi:MAG: hypothetical protein IPL07_08340 [Acidimicrobiaceae bacterium]|nr:hypothetical protein [Acidimicrobiaceae bacterium]
MTRLPRPLAASALAVLSVLTLAAGCSGQNPYQAADSANSAAIDDSSASGTPSSEPAGNVFTPEDANVSSCVGTLERPDCGSKSKGGWRMYLTFAVLMGGMSFIGWRITKSVRQRDAILNHGTPDREANDTAANDTPPTTLKPTTLPVPTARPLPDPARPHRRLPGRRRTARV